MFTLIGVVLGLGAVFLLLWSVDVISVARGLGPAHPLSPAVAYALLLGSLLLTIFVVFGLSIDTHKARPTAEHRSALTTEAKDA